MVRCKQGLSAFGSLRVAPPAMRASMVVCLLSASVQAIGLARGGDRSASLLAPGRKDMECEEGCSFRPFCLPGACYEGEECATEPALCTDETWESCTAMKEACPRELRTELCSNATDEVCEQRMGIEVFDRQAQAAERAEAKDNGETDVYGLPVDEDVFKPAKPKQCMTMSSPQDDDWCSTITCDLDAANCAAAKLCDCSSFTGVPPDGATRVACDIACGCAELPDARCKPVR